MNPIQLCFAYKLNQPVTYLVLSMVDPLFKTLSNINVKIDLKADNEWHYNCINIKDNWLALANDSKYSFTNMKVYSARFYPGYGMVDVVSVRKSPPLGISVESEDRLKLNQRRVFPSIQYQAASLSVTKNASSIGFSFRPTNCSSNLPLFELINSYTDVLFDFVFYIKSRHYPFALAANHRHLKIQLPKKILIKSS